MSMKPDMMRTWAEIDLEALRHNIHFVRRQVGPKVRIMATVKADAYGHGLPQIAGVLMQTGVDMFGVATLGEAMGIRSVGTGWNILLLGACLPWEIRPVVAHRFSPVLSSVEEARLFDAEAERQGIVLPVHVAVDTGMGRLGFWHGDAAEQIASLKALAHLELRGIHTHFSSADTDASFTRRQTARFRAVLSDLKARGMEFPLVHAANSAGILRGPDAHFSLVRPGILIYGSSPVARWRRALRPALSLKARVTFVKEVGPGRTISYGRSFTASRRMRVATVSIGYGDGYPRRVSGRAFVLVGGHRCRQLGRVTMDQIMVDVSRVPGVRAGDEVVLIGSQESLSITADQVARWADTIPYEVFTGITKRVPRVYTGATAA